MHTIETRIILNIMPKWVVNRLINRIPAHMWNFKLTFRKFNNITRNNARFYSVHSYYVSEADTSVVAGTTDYGVDFTCAVAKDNMFAVQFHPEKSQYDGLQLLTNFINWKV